MLNVVNIANCGSVLPRITHSLFDRGRKREHPQANFSTLLEGWFSGVRSSLVGQLVGRCERTPLNSDDPSLGVGAVLGYQLTTR